jgi:ankyrin repeat protein
VTARESRRLLKPACGVYLLTITVASAAWAADSPLADALERGDRDAAAALIRDGADVRAAGADGTTALHWAVRADDEPLIAALIAAGPDLNARNRYGITPLHLAAMNGRSTVVRRLLDAGAIATEATLPSGETVLMTAARTGDLETVRVLLRLGVIDINAKETIYGATAIMWAAAQRHAPVVRLLAEYGADVNLQSRQFSNAERGAAFSTVIRGGFTALLFAAREGAIDVVTTLIALGADLERADPDGVTPLIEAIINGHLDVAATLVERGANVNRVDLVGRGPLFAAVEMNTIEWTPNRPPPRITSTRDALDIVRLLLARGADADAPLTGQAPARKGDAYPDPVLIAGATPFLRAAKGADLAIMRLLLEHGANPNVSTSNGTTPLMAASGVYWRDASSRAPERDAVEAAKLCVSLGADVNAVNDEGKTALHGAAARGSNLLAQLLADHGANLFARNAKGHTPLDEAEVGGNYSNGATGERHPEQPHTAALLRALMQAAETARRPGPP